MSFKDISYLELWRPFCSLEQSHLCNFGRGHYEEYFSEIILKFGTVVQEDMSFKYISIQSSDNPFCSVKLCLV